MSPSTPLPPEDKLEHFRSVSVLLVEALGVSFADLDWEPLQYRRSVRVFRTQPVVRSVRLEFSEEMMTGTPAQIAERLAAHLRPQVDLWLAGLLAETLE